MRPVSIVAFLACAGTLSCSGRLHAQDAPVSETPLATLADSNEVTAIASLKVRLQLEDQTPFLASASVRLLHTDSHEGQELLGFTKSTGELLFSGITSGKYLIAISAAGYQELRLITHLDAGPRQKTLFVPMKPKLAVTDEPRMQILQPSPTEPSDAPPDAAYAGKEPISASASPAESKDGAKHDPASANEAPPEPRANGQPDYWNPHELEEVPPVDLNIACPADELLSGVGQRVSEFVDTLERFAATEKLEHYAEQRDGARKDPETRTFAYVVSIKQNTWGGFSVDEYRNGGSTDPEAFPARTATLGSPAMALIFHPVMADSFAFRCEGMGLWHGRQVWQVHFVQRPDKPNRIRSFRLNLKAVDVPLEGRAWIEPGSYQLLRLESELVKPLPEVALTREHFTIEYKPERFRSTQQQIWLPQVAELYVERKGKRYYRRHTWSDFALFSVDVTQNIRAPGESFGFTNDSDRDVLGELTVTRREGAAGEPVTLRFVVPAHGKVFKVVGPGKDVNMPVLAVGEATFLHEGDPGSVKVDSYSLKESSLEVVPQTPLVSQKAPPSRQP